MSKKTLLAIALIFLALLCVQSITSSNMTATAAIPSQLKIYVGPTSVLADNQVYSIIVVQMLDSKGYPVRAIEDTTISLTSSLTNIGNVDPTVTIAKGSTQATTNFYATYTPGTTTITAAASGYMTVQAPITTVGPIPSTVAVYGSPQTLPANGQLHKAVVVQLQDSGGSPAKAPNEGVEITLSSSNIAIGTVSSTIVIPGGSTYAVADFTTTYTPGTVIITPIASGYASKTATFTTKQLGGTPANLQVYIAPPKVPADGDIYQQIIVQLQDNKNVITQTNQETIVTLSSSNTAVGTIQQTIRIPAGQTYVRTNFSTTYSSGTTTITAAATGCVSDQASLTTVGPIPTKLAVYGLPSVLPADNQPIGIIQVQLQDSSGRPAKDPNGDITVYLFSSTPDIGIIDTTLTIPFGQTYTTGVFTSSYEAYSTTITAQASGYTTGQTKITTYIADQIFVNVSAIANPTSFKAGEQTTIRAFVTYDGLTPSAKAAVVFASDKGGNFTTIVNEGNGYYAVNFTAPKVTQQTTFTITANATKTGYTSTTQDIQLIIEPNPILFPTTTPRPTPSSTPIPTPKVTPTPIPTSTLTPTPIPTQTPPPTPAPSASPTTTPTPSPTSTPTIAPTQKPSTTPPSSPSNQPTNQPTTSPQAQAGLPIEILITAVTGTAFTITIFALPYTRNRLINLTKKDQDQKKRKKRRTKKPKPTDETPQQN